MAKKQSFGEAKDGTKFTAESPEVIAYLAEFPDVELDAAIGSVVNTHNQSLIIVNDDKVLVKFLKHYTPYVAGDVTSITLELLEKLTPDGFVEVI